MSVRVITQFTLHTQHEQRRGRRVKTYLFVYLFLVLVLMLLDVQRNLVFSAPTQISSNDFDTAKSLTNILAYDTKELLQTYVQVSTTELFYHEVILLDTIYFLRIACFSGTLCNA